MSSMEDRINKLRQERVAREKARIEKLREMNLKKYPKTELRMNAKNQLPNSKNIPSSTNISLTKNGMSKKNDHIGGNRNVKNNLHVNGIPKRPDTAPVPKNLDFSSIKPITKVPTKIVSRYSKSNVGKSENHGQNNKVEGPVASTSNSNKIDAKISLVKNSDAEISFAKPNDTKIPFSKSGDAKIKMERQSILHINRNLSKVSSTPSKNQETKNDKTNIMKNVGFDKPKTNTARKSVLPILADKPNSILARKSLLPNLPENVKSESVFERLYKPKFIAKKHIDEVEKLKTDPNYLKKIIKTSNTIMHKRHTCFAVNGTGDTNIMPRRSISAVHFKRISRNELGNCIHRSSSVDKINKGDLDLNEDDSIKEDKFVSAIKSERKKAKFMTPIPSNFNTPTPKELQSRLKSWLQKRGKNIDSYHHLQCFGINHMMSDLVTPKYIQFNDGDNARFNEENKENIALDSDSDDGSYLDTINEPEVTLCPDNKIDIDNWRRASIDSESLEFNESTNYNASTITSACTPCPNVDELLIGALNDLAALLREGFDWQQSARWLRAIRERFPHAPRTAAYWECRAALEDSRGDLPASVHCWEEAIAKGTEHSVADSNLDQILDKFMQLKISPKSGTPKYPDSKLLDVKNVFKSTIIKFAVQQAKLRRQSEIPTAPVFTVTPVRRSTRPSRCPPRTPLQLCDTLRQAAKIAPQHIFTPNENFVATP